MREDRGVIPDRRPSWINRALVAFTLVAVLAGLLLSQWRVVLRYAELL